MTKLSTMLLFSFQELMKKERQYEQQVQQALLEALNEMRGEMQLIYDKFAVNGKLSLADVEKYNRYSVMEKQMLDRLLPAVKENIKTIKEFLPEQYAESFNLAHWIVDNSIGAHIGISIVSKEVLLELFSIANKANKFYAEALKNYPVEAQLKLRQALLNGLQLGKSFESMSNDLKHAVDISYNSALKIIRTEGMAALNHGADDAYLKAMQMGVEGSIVWSAVLDLKTRETHAAMDGKIKREDGFFDGPGAYRAPYPGWEGLPPEERCNCRCVLMFSPAGYKPELRRTKEQGIIEYMDYNTWLNTYHPDIAEKRAKKR